ncbi:tRNA (adenosine(37)-N6)-threonylcarbamoyltransferase complex transferase subunit TsaD [Marinitoga litoralis]|jgi:N6-L-threonylcarbamoyladenine synthase|uniref:tRNA (adenosine(37)-N6)-threonylcarbamoyltransferase complex transferase subunit TsaD n=1 Tax=Marinitoga litoralis TaxID=570855 RepID=UPI001961B513|nr:tRNA (adenosine(37)-N6)-threonylcarbamoyltransferase complex transferase subunit TsaD [Marinitoga litoralis]MBM7560286.1 N6-L-threonylcarbamoyladenine synthase [Marinitoga litoralis]
MEPIIFSIETSCDETAVAILKGKNEVLSHLVVSQIDIHKIFGGVVPEIASRKHLNYLNTLTEKAFNEANIKTEEISAVAVTYGPGLVGALLIGLNFAKGLALNLNKPLIGVNHLYGHIYANFLAFPELKPPFLVLLVSGGHTMILHAKDYLHFEIVGQTIDDAAGEAFDKVARMLNLGYPGGPKIDKLAQNGNPIYDFPKPLYHKGYDFSFSGLKTALLYFTKENDNYRIEDVAASFQKALIDTLIYKTIKASKDLKVNDIIIAGGVAANSYLRKKINEEKEKNKRLNIYFPPLNLCTDNALMIARAAYEKYIRNQFADLNLDAIPNLGLKDIC